MEENHDEQHFTERELAGSHAFATRWDQLFPLAIFEDLCKISDTAKQSDDRRVHEGGILSVGFDFVRILNQVTPDFGIPINPLIQNWRYYVLLVVVDIKNSFFSICQEIAISREYRAARKLSGLAEFSSESCLRPLLIHSLTICGTLALNSRGLYFQSADFLLSFRGALTFNLRQQRKQGRSNHMYTRHAKLQIEEALEDTRVVLISGPRQSGKTTLSQDVAGIGMEYLTLDDPTTLDAAQADPVGFLRDVDRAVIDEVQRAPNLLLAIKKAVDEDKRPGRFLLAGSANLMTIPKVADSLAGRMETVLLLPLAQSEIYGQRSNFVDNLLTGKKPTVGKTILGDDLVDIVFRGGYPEALSRNSWSRRQNWYRNYIIAIVQRDIKDIAQIEQLGAMPGLLRMVAEHSGQLVNYTSIGSAVGLNHVTTRKYLRVFESLFLVEMVQPWFTNRIKRLTKSPKLHFLDAGLLAAMRNLSPDNIRRDRTIFGALLETLVYSEMRKIIGWSDPKPSVYHFRDREGDEVDIILEAPAGLVSGVEVKASASVSNDDFIGLRKISEVVPDRFTQGVVLYDGDQVVPFGNKLFAAPISSLWSTT